MLNHSPALDLVFQALADSTRRAMVERLTRGPASVSALAGPLGMSLPAVMQHLRVLEASGLVRTEKAGRVRFPSKGGSTGQADDRTVGTGPKV